MIAEYTKETIRVLNFLDDDLTADIVMLCLCVVAIDGKISLREKNYIKQLCKR